MAMHPRVSLHQVAFLGESSASFIEFCREIGVHCMTLVTPVLGQPGDLEGTRAELAKGGPRAATLNHVVAVHPDIPGDSGKAAASLSEAIGMAASLGASQIYLITGGRGGLDWEAAALRWAELIAPCKGLAEASGVRLLVENASAMNVDIHVPLTLGDAVRFAELAGIGVCVELHACWMEGNLKEKLRRAMPITGLVQVSDYVLGDRTTPCRAVPGDGAIPLEQLIGDVLELGYEGLFDLELVGPRIAEEGSRDASRRACDYLSNLLIKLGA
jgi:sugar phosphate isomerase/epimerase